MAIEKEIIEDAMKMTKDIPWTDVLTPILTEEEAQEDESFNYRAEYLVVMEKTLDKFERKMNEASSQWWYPSGGMTVCQTSTGNTFYILLERGVVWKEEPVLDDNPQEDVNDWETDWWTT